MTAMHAIEIANRHHGAGKRTAIDALRTAVRNMEVFFRHRLAHWMCRRIQEIAVVDLHIFSSGEHLARCYGYRAVNKLSN